MCLKHNKNKYTLKYSVMSCLSYSWGWFGCWCLFFTSKKWWLQNDPVTENCLPLVSQQWFNSKGSRLVEIAEEILSWFDCLWCCKIILLPHPPPITLLPLHVIKDIYKRTSHREQPQISEDSFVSTGNRSRQQLLRHYSHSQRVIQLHTKPWPYQTSKTETSPANGAVGL